MKLTSGIGRAAAVALLCGIALATAGCQNHGDTQKLEAGYAALEQKRYDQAITAADQYLAQNPPAEGSAEALYLRGRAIFAREKATPAQSAADMREASSMYTRALAMSPAAPVDARIRADLANIAFHQDNYTTAEREWLAAYEKLDDPNVKAIVLYQVARARQRMTPPNWTGADQVFDMVIKNWPNTDLAQKAQEKRGYREFWVQVAAMRSSADADKMLQTLRASGNTGIQKATPSAILVLVGPLPSYSAAKAKRDQLAATYKDAFIRP